jgi:hypothetical protein
MMKNGKKVTKRGKDHEVYSLPRTHGEGDCPPPY